MDRLTIVTAETGPHYEQLRELLAELVALDITHMRELGLDTQAALEFYYASGEEELPGVYAPPAGCLLLATYGGETAGCAAFRTVSSDTCELKRMYVRPKFRSKQIGWALANTLIQTARDRGHNFMRLETTSYLDKAIKLYSALGFRICPPYYPIPQAFREFTICMELKLV